MPGPRLPSPSPRSRARSRLTTRLRAELGYAIAEQGRVVSETAAHYGASWPVVHAAFVEHVRVPLAAALPPVKVLGIDETRRGKPIWARDPDTNRWVLACDRWHTGLCATRRCLFRLEVKDPMTKSS